MNLSDKLLNELISLENDIRQIRENKNVYQIQIESFLISLERKRFNILNEIKLYNSAVEYKTERIKNINDEYKAEVQDNILKIYIPEPMPSYKNLKTHAFKNILLNLTEITKPFENMFKDEIFIYIKIYDNIKNWDIDNKCIKPIPDALILSSVIKDDNIDKMFYSVKGEFSEKPHTEVYILNANEIAEFLENHIS